MGEPRFNQRWLQWERSIYAGAEYIGCISKSVSGDPAIEAVADSTNGVGARTAVWPGAMQWFLTVEAAVKWLIDQWNSDADPACRFRTPQNTL